MLLNEGTLIIVADGAQARLIEEQRRRGPPHARNDASGGLSPSVQVGFGAPGRVFDRFARGSHPAAGANPHGVAEDGFLETVADRVAELDVEHAFDALLLAAPPRALGQLRAALADGPGRRPRHAESKARLRDGLEAPHDIVAGIRRRGS